ncbi:aldolase/citrate lyase family protein [Tardiphaga sp. 866_E4_N2_1]|uniref:aldolase/citrate lyase family protein n=1 Tax=unclassified Tardiphaga TaxID=2631404 RepID=UPI003F288EFA
MKHLLATGGAAIAANSGGGALPVVDVLADFGVSCLFIDCERTAISVENVPVLARAAQARGMSAIVRGPSKDSAVLTRCLDCCIDGLVLPGVESAQKCVLLRSVDRTAARGREADLAPMAQIESLPGGFAWAEISSSSGIDAVLVGPSDLAHSMGRLGDIGHPEVASAVDGLVTDLAIAGKPFGLPVTPSSAREWLGRGARLLYVSLATLMAPGLRDLRGIVR